MTLALEIEFLMAVSFAAVSPDSTVPDWPPQPDRVFSALVASWAARGSADDEADALKWLESLPAPRIRESGADPRTPATAYVPPNDPRSDRRKTAKGVLPAFRSRQPRQFPAARPNDPTIHFIWPGVSVEPATLAALSNLAGDTAYVGHSSSLTRCRFLETPNMDVADTTLPARRVYRGRLRELQVAYARFALSADRKDRPLAGARVVAPPLRDLPRTNHYGTEWLLLEHVGGVMPDLRACALVARTIRDALLAGYHRIQLGDRIPEIVSGHALDGSPSRQHHLAIVPLAFAGFPHADGGVLGFALVPPHDSPILKDESFLKALRGLAPLDEVRERRVLTITTQPGATRDQAFSVELSPALEATRASLDPARYLTRARTFATITPIALDRHLKGQGRERQREGEAQIAVACRNIGLPQPERIVADKHSAIQGSPSAYPSGNAPAWTRWRAPRSLASRQLTHAVVQFSEPVNGPVILGAGRFSGLGLFLPLDAEA